MLSWVLRNKIAFIAALAMIPHATGAIQFHLNRDMFHEFLKANVADYPWMIAWLVGYIDSPLYSALEVAMVWSPSAIIALGIFIMGNHWSFFDCDPAGE